MYRLLRPEKDAVGKVRTSGLKLEACSCPLCLPLEACHLPLRLYSEPRYQAVYLLAQLRQVLTGLGRLLGAVVGFAG